MIKKIQPLFMQETSVLFTGALRLLLSGANLASVRHLSTKWWRDGGQMWEQTGD